MYIGPWQEYRLAKIQDDAIQRIRQEWEDNIRAQLPDGDDARIRELMQPLMAKLPALLMAKKSADCGDASATPGSRKARRPPASAMSSHSRQSTRPSTAISTASSTRSRAERTESCAPAQTPDAHSNQDTHDSNSTTEVTSTRPRKPVSRQASGKKKKKSGSGSAVSTALEDVEKRKKMFAKWLRQTPVADTIAASADPQTVERTRLPPIHPDSQSHSPSQGRLETTIPAEAIHLPPLVHSEWEPSETQSEPQAPSPRDEPNLEDSLDEDEVNQLLNWTDNLLSPHALDLSLAGMDEEELGAMA